MSPRDLAALSSEELQDLVLHLRAEHARAAAQWQHGEQESRRLERQRQEAQRLESLGVLAGGIAHDFNNLLTIILGYTTLAASELPRDSEAAGMLGEVERAARRAAELTHQMLAYAGRGKFAPQPLDLSGLVRDLSHSLQLLAPPPATLTIEAAPGLTVIEADGSQLRQVLLNLVTNAVEALPGSAGAITVRTGVEVVDHPARLAPLAAPDARPGPHVYLEVADDGCGIPTDVLPRIFDPFFSTKFTGRGLGLAAVLGIVRGHGGLIAVNSTPGRGSRFRLYFPCLEAPPPSPAPTWQGSGTALVVEDEEGVRQLARHILEGAGFQVLLAHDGLEGVEVFRDRGDSIAVVLLDLTMPRLSGPETLAELRRLRPLAPVVLMTGYSEGDWSERFAGQTWAAYVQKPFDAERLLTAVQLALIAE
jgi:signal transduction histidine kinase/CheY-like chemotaxis protein